MSRQIPVWTALRPYKLYVLQFRNLIECISGSTACESAYGSPISVTEIRKNIIIIYFTFWANFLVCFQGLFFYCKIIFYSIYGYIYFCLIGYYLTKAFYIDISYWTQTKIQRSIFKEEVYLIFYSLQQIPFTLWKTANATQTM